MAPLAVTLSLCLISVCTQAEDYDDYPTNIPQTQENINNFVLQVNKRAKGNWTASSDFISLFPIQTLQNLASKNRVIDPQNKKLYMSRDKMNTFITPASFSVSKHWPKCADMISRVPKMLATNCATGWATAMASVLTDRLCILSRGQDKVELSPVEILQCCQQCNPKKHNCEGDAIMGWKFWLDNGIVSGEFSDSTPSVTGCKPYSKDALHLPCLKECTSGVPPPKSLHANVSNSSLRYMQEKKQSNFGKNIYVLLGGAEYIKSEIHKSGPVQAAFKLHTDFFAYHSGVYVHVHGEFIGYHSVKIVGWGRDNHTFLDYWLVVNVWGTKYGDNGMVKFLRGVNHCEIEENVIGASYDSINHHRQQFSGNNDTIALSGTLPVLNTCRPISFFIIAFIVYKDL